MRVLDLRRAAAGVAVLLVAACTPPGVRSEGTAQVDWADGIGSFTGPCTYEVTTRWAAQLNHIVRLEEQGGDDAIVIQNDRRLPRGRSSFRDHGASGPIMGLAMDGGTVRGGLTGTIEVSEEGEEEVLAVTGARAGRDTVGLRATCRLRSVER